MTHRILVVSLAAALLAIGPGSVRAAIDPTEPLSAGTITDTVLPPVVAAPDAEALDSTSPEDAPGEAVQEAFLQEGLQATDAATADIAEAVGTAIGVEAETGSVASDLIVSLLFFATFQGTLLASVLGKVRCHNRRRRCGAHPFLPIVWADPAN